MSLFVAGHHFCTHASVKQPCASKLKLGPDIAPPPLLSFPVSTWLTGCHLHPAAGRLAADIIASKPQDSQAKELCSFALLNLTWNSIVKLLQLLAGVSDQPRITQGKHTDGALSLRHFAHAKLPSRLPCFKASAAADQLCQAAI